MEHVWLQAINIASWKGLSELNVRKSEDFPANILATSQPVWRISNEHSPVPQSHKIDPL